MKILLSAWVAFLLLSLPLFAKQGSPDSGIDIGNLSKAQVEQFQNNRQAIEAYLNDHKDALHLDANDISNWAVSDLYSNRNSGITYIYLHQQCFGIKVFNAVSSMSIREEKVLSFANRFYAQAQEKVNTKSAVINPGQAISKAMDYLGLTLTENPVLIKQNKINQRYTFEKSTLSQEPIVVSLVYQPMKSKLILAWNVNLFLKDGSHWWNIRIDAVSGEFLAKNDWTKHCDFGSSSNGDVQAGENVSDDGAALPSSSQSSSVSMVPVYNVLPLPIESPSFGSRVLLSDPADPTASPFGWHDTDGITGSEYTITRGNNVFAYDDIANQDVPGSSADGGGALNFDFPLILTQQPSTYLEASLTNLFYLNNTIHDIMYRYGFDEDAGNYQSNNYGHGGIGDDYVLAECQDGGGSNNANFSAPEDGINGRMQMYLWTNSAPGTLVVNSPGSIAGSYTTSEPAFGPGLSVPVTGNFVIADDGAPINSDACTPLVNGVDINGNIALIDRGTCNFVDKVLAAQTAGAIAVIVINNVAGAPFSMGSNGNGNLVTIPSVMISLTDGNTIKGVLTGGNPVNGTLNPAPGGSSNLDGSLDNGIVIHEYGHGISVRLTGGPNNSNCLDNGEEGGEGWSDWFALMLTLEDGDQGTDARGMGTYVFSEPNNGPGIRRYPYSTNMNINSQTYGDLAQSGEVHDIGEIWCTVLWDMTWGLIDQYGFDPDWIIGTSGNNIAMQLVIEGLKLQPCGPGFLDSRDAILQADDNLYGGVHKCIIWEAFARRGMGALASQGDPNNAGDETEDFSLPAICTVPTAPPIADFTADVTSTCIGTINFTDLSTNIPQSWLWDFGDNSATSAIQNPSHTYSTNGDYTVKLVVTNILGDDSLTRTTYIHVNFPASPLINGNTSLCVGDSTTLTADVVSGNTAEWSDSSGQTLLFTGISLDIPPLTNPVTYSVRQIIPTSIQHVGPSNATFGTGGYHNTTFEGRELFTAIVPFRLLSVWVDASGTASRTINLYNGNGTLIQSQAVNIPNGQSRVPINFNIPAVGNYQIGVSAGSNLFRNNAGATYPYLVNGVVSITGSNSTSNPATFYYYLYDWEVQETPCQSPPVIVNVNVSPAPASSFNTTSTGLSASFTDQSIGNPVSWFWDFGNGMTSTQQDTSIIYNQTGTYTVTLTITNSSGCQATSTQTVTITDTGIENPTLSNLTVYSSGQNVIVQFGHTLNEHSFITIFDVLGRTISSEEFNHGSVYTHKIENIKQGFVLVSVKEKDIVSYQKVFISEN